MSKTQKKFQNSENFFNPASKEKYITFYVCCKPL